MSDYRYLGDRMTRPELRGADCDAVRRPDGKCKRGRLGGMEVRFVATGERCIVLGRLLRKNHPHEHEQGGVAAAEDLAQPVQVGDHASAE